MPILTRLYNIGANVAYWLKNTELDFLDDVFPDDNLSTPSPTKDLSSRQQVKNMDKIGAPGTAKIEAAQKSTPSFIQPDKDDAESSDCLFTPRRQFAKRDAQRSKRSISFIDLPPAKRPKLVSSSHEAADEQTAHKKLQPS